ncbi:unnamed protein product [Heligmosomoides polygyrus]|uniref:DUF4440 domain-containing protein n=1 Tax=Heligmosomoides polygyrus TaxID=6339 RepID=A0A183G9X0_HELPZ|nr:unnamed protein product [Heligmosomoides polygyrus]
MTLEMKTFLEIQDEELQLYLKHTNNRIARLDSEVEQKAEEAEHLADFYTENGPVLTEEQRRAIYLKIEDAMKDLNWDDKGYLVDGKRISNLRFADDIGRSGGNAERAQCGRHCMRFVLFDEKGLMSHFATKTDIIAPNIAESGMSARQ